MTPEEFDSRARSLGLDPADFEETFSHSGGPGGQNVNKVATAVTILYRPAQLAVRVQESRSQLKNRQLARSRILELIQSERKKAALAARQAREKERRRKSPRPRGVKERILETKRRRSAVKRSRQKPGE